MHKKEETMRGGGRYHGIKEVEDLQNTINQH